MGNYKIAKKRYVEYDKKNNKSLSYDENNYKEKYSDKPCSNKYEDDYYYGDKSCDVSYIYDDYPEEKGSCNNESPIKEQYKEDSCCASSFAQGQSNSCGCCCGNNCCCNNCCGNNCGCNNCGCSNSYDNIKSASFIGDCCTQTMRQALEIIKEVTRGASETLDTVVYTTDGSTFAVRFARSNCPVIITDDAVISNSVAIALNSISKIQILTSSLSQSFRSKLLSRLKKLSQMCENPYLAYDLDDESYCPQCKQEQCNCKYDNALGDYVINNVDELSEVSRMGNSKQIFNVIKVNSTSVVDNIEPVIYTQEVLESGELKKSFENVISNVSAISKGVVDNITTNNQEVVKDIQQTTEKILTASFVEDVDVVSSISPFTTFVVQNISTKGNNINVVNNYSTEQVIKGISNSSDVATNIADYNTSNFVNEINTNEVQVVQSIEEFPINVIGSVSSTTLVGLSGITHYTKDVVNNVTPVKESVVVASNPSFADAITKIDTNTLTLNKDISISTSQAITDVHYTPINVVNGISTNKIQVVDNMSVSSSEVMNDLTLKTIPVVDEVDYTTRKVVSGLTAETSDVMLYSKDYFLVNNVLSNLSMNNIQKPKTMSVGNCLGEGTLEVSAKNVPVSIVNFTNNLTNKLNYMIKDINNILKECFDSKNNGNCCNCCNCCNCNCCNCCDSSNSCHCDDNKENCPTIPYFTVGDLLEDVYFDLNADVTINGKPAVSKCVNISVFDDNTNNYVQNVNSGSFANGVLAGVNVDNHQSVIKGINLSLADVVNSVNYTTMDAINNITYTVTEVVKDVDFGTQVINQLQNFTTADVVKNVSPQRANFVNNVSLANPVEIVSSITPVTDVFVSKLDSDSTRIVTDVTFGTTDVISSVNPVTSVYVNSITTSPQTVLKDITVNSIDVVRDLSYEVEEGISDLVTKEQRFLTDVTPANVSVVSNLTLSSENVVNSIGASGVQVVYDVNPKSTNVTKLDNTNLTTVVTNVKPETLSVTTVNTVSKSTVASVEDVSKVNVIKDVQLETKDTKVVSDIELEISKVDVVESLEGENTNVLLGNSRERISSVSASAGNGILISEEQNGDISVYSLCKLQSVGIDRKDCK